jgi:hypothetical protein
LRLLRDYAGLQRLRLLRDYAGFPRLRLPRDYAGSSVHQFVNMHPEVGEVVKDAVHVVEEAGHVRQVGRRAPQGDDRVLQEAGTKS